MNRKELLKKLSKYKTLSGYKPNYDSMTDEELEKYLNTLEDGFETYFKDEK
ncbi:hypothetical protein phiCTC2B_25 (endogenous virus) [Clostridium phage phiCTC2B]|uniref:hypothetical protein n=1 Tax=Clostridium phage phiCT19406C TaxID=1567011 RepID=UPI000316EB71|nr:hypothetical protein [Clostridium tetani]YP_009218057.1 hypothetical protein phiCT19406C_28 [Clostridium phage phiCT19406C]YP_009276922.1 hypothetical protein phiCT19406B_25 [Clostridium phage phiCT19406B]YP_009277366.1 hypothetical protein phiCTC2B_25 [Clostridium phage phiCTC2B]AJA42782.1 hypothetical protein phiCT19406B_25 [Clostridium phage phiCT19406B]AJA42851.1 hypothetical protein phiCT19406C_28 [Clostridium phage phiCT19406C]AJA42978.1 hypothetical protein phiCTC2B_25 [Clostridium 